MCQNGWQDEAFFKRLCRFFFEQRSHYFDVVRASSEHLGAMFEELLRTVADELSETSIAHTKDDAANTAPEYRPGAHWAGFGIYVKRAVA